MEKQVNGLINFNENVRNSLVYNSSYYRGTNPFCYTTVQLFELDGHFFEFSHHGSYSGSCESLVEISKERYEEKKDAYPNMYPWKDGYYDDGTYRHSLKISESAVFNEAIAPKNIKSSHPAILAIMDEIAAAIEEAARQQREKEAAERKEYARNCGRVAKRLGISFVNVLRLGYQNEEQLKEFQKSLMAAKKRLSSMSEEDREYYEHEIFGCGRARIASALASLGVQTFGRDVRYMDFSLLSND